MTPVEIILQFTAIAFPVFLAIPSFIAYFAPWPTSKLFRFILLLYFVSFIDLWASVILGCWTLLSRLRPECLMAMFTLLLSAVLLSYAMVTLARFLSERAMQRVAEEP